ncbi:unnamed protein product [Musa acuminata var. zebrina]
MWFEWVQRPTTPHPLPLPLRLPLVCKEDIPFGSKMGHLAASLCVSVSRLQSVKIQLVLSLDNTPIGLNKYFDQSTTLNKLQTADRAYPSSFKLLHHYKRIMKIRISRLKNVPAKEPKITFKDDTF